MKRKKIHVSVVPGFNINELLPVYWLTLYIEFNKLKETTFTFAPSFWFTIISSLSTTTKLKSHAFSIEFLFTELIYIL